MEIRLTRKEDIPQLMEVFEIAKKFMRSTGNLEQWINGYPTEDVLMNDIANGWSHTVTDNTGNIIGTFCMMTVPEPTYIIIRDGEWLNDSPYVTIHRIASDGSTHGILRKAVEYALMTGKDVRIDTHADNLPMRNAVTKLGFTRCGIINIADGSERIAFQFVNSHKPTDVEN